MITVPEAARRTGKNPETIRRWIREGKLASRKVGTQHTIDEVELDDFLEADQLLVPVEWRRMADGRAMPNIVAAVRRSRTGH